MNKRDRDRPFTDRRGDAFDIASANIPGSENSGQAGFQQVGRRVRGQRAPVSSSEERSGPVLMKPLLSSTTQPLSQPVLGFAPVITNTWAMFFSSALPDLLLRHVTPSRWSTPMRLTTSVFMSRLMLGVCSIRRMRYFDIVSVRPGPLTSIYTCF